MPPFNGYGGYYPQNYQPFQQSFQQPQVVPQGIAGRMVTSREEALGVPADLSGAPMFMPDLGHGVIYVKKFDPNTGSSNLFEFRLSQEPIQTYAPADGLKAAVERIEKLENLVAELAKT